MALQLPIPLTTLRGHIDCVNSLSFFANDRIVSGDGAGNMKIWNLQTRRPILDLYAHEKSIQSVDVDNNSLLSSGRDGMLKLWDMEAASSSMNPVLSMKSNCEHFCNAVLYNNKGSHLIASPDHDSSILLWDIRCPTSPCAIFRFVAPETTTTTNSNPLLRSGGGMVMSLFFGSSSSSSQNQTDGNNEHLLFGGYEDGSIGWFDMRTTTTLAAIKNHAEPVMALDVSPNERFVYSGGGDNLLVRSELNNSTVAPSQSQSQGSFDALTSSILPSCDNSSLQFHQEVKLKTAGTSCIRHRNDGRMVVSTHWDGVIRVFDHVKLKPLAILKHHRGSTYGLDFEKCPADAIYPCTKFAVGSKDGEISIWNLFADSYRPK